MIQSISDLSPLFSLVLPGDIITACNDRPASSAEKLARQCVTSDKLLLHVHTPFESAETVAFVKKNDGHNGFQIGTDKRTGMACIAHTVEMFLREGIKA